LDKIDVENTSLQNTNSNHFCIHEKQRFDQQND